MLIILKTLGAHVEEIVVALISIFITRLASVEGPILVMPLEFILYVLAKASVLFFNGILVCMFLKGLRMGLVINFC